MKYYFILNPESGNKKHKNDILRDIRDAARKLGEDFDVYFTKAPGDARRYVREVCETHAKANTGTEPETIRIIGCGGDGTVNELVNGAYGYANVEIGVIPQGTGNDYIRNYGDPAAFRNVENLMLGSCRPSDLIEYRARIDRKEVCGLCANMFNIGFDCNVVDMTDRVKQLPLMGGSMAYLASVFIVLARKKETNLRIEYEDGTAYDDKLLLVSIANGCFCGGGIKGVPRSVLDDGLMDISLVRGGVTRKYFVSLFPKYQKGTHLEDPRIEGVIDYRQESSLIVSANEGQMKLCVDGEIFSCEAAKFRVIPKAIRFIVPHGL